MPKAIIIEGTRCAGKTTIANKIADYYGYRYYKDHKRDDAVEEMHRIMERANESPDVFVLDRFHMTEYVMRAAEKMLAESSEFRALVNTSWPIVQMESYNLFGSMEKAKWHERLVSPLCTIDELARKASYITVVLTGDEALLDRRLVTTGRKPEMPYLCQKFFWEYCVLRVFRCPIYIDSRYPINTIFTLLKGVIADPYPRRKL